MESSKSIVDALSKIFDLKHFTSNRPTSHDQYQTVVKMSRFVNKFLMMTSDQM